jgi:hypothetical protein
MPKMLGRTQGVLAMRLDRFDRNLFVVLDALPDGD